MPAPHHVPAATQAAGEAALVFCLAYVTAYGETLTIAHFPYYSFQVGWGREGGGVLRAAVLRLGGAG